VRTYAVVWHLRAACGVRFAAPRPVGDPGFGPPKGRVRPRYLPKTRAAIGISLSLMPMGRSKRRPYDPSNLSGRSTRGRGVKLRCGWLRVVEKSERFLDESFGGLGGMTTGVGNEGGEFD
jgi:hypothetical protein